MWQLSGCIKLSLVTIDFNYCYKKKLFHGRQGTGYAFAFHWNYSKDVIKLLRLLFFVIAVLMIIEIVMILKLNIKFYIKFLSQGKQKIALTGQHSS